MFKHSTCLYILKFDFELCSVHFAFLLRTNLILLIALKRTQSNKGKNLIHESVIKNETFKYHVC